MRAASATLPGLLRHAAAEYADREAIHDPRDDTRLTFAELLEEVRGAARAYVGLGLAPAERVCVWAPNSWRWEVAALAVTYAGGVLVPLNTRYTGYEAADVVERSHARIVVIEDGFLDRSQAKELAEAGAEVAVVDLAGWDAFVAGAGQVDVADVEARADAVTPDDVADILFTSGTTGRSKGARSAHRQTIEVSWVWAELGGVTTEDRYLVVNPFFHSFGYKIGIVVSLLTGAALVPQAVFDVEEMLRLIGAEAITLLPGAPAIYHSLLEAPGREDADLSSLRLAVTGAATVPVALVERMQSELSFDTVLTAFGMTECVVGTMCRPGDADGLVASTCGPVVPGLELRIAEPGTNDELPAGEEGELLFRGDTVMLGYLDDAEATAEAVDAGGWLHTGDIGRVDEQGYLKVTDRLKDMYICGGFNVYPAEVEQELARLDGVVESAVVGVPDERMGEVGRAFVVRREGATLSGEDVRTFATQRLAKFKVPREVEFVDVLPRNLAGKVLKTQLRGEAGG